MDKIHIRGLRLYGYHGVNDYEKRKGQPFELDITLYADLSRPCATDNVEDTLNYSTVSKTVLRVMEGENFNLLERAAQRVAEELLGEFSTLHGVNILLKKPRAPVAADFSYVAVEIYRERERTEEEQG